MGIEEQEAMNEALTLYKDAATGLDYAGDIGETTPVSWQPRGTLDFEEWIAIGNTLQQVNASLNWWIGDWLNYGERKWGEMYAQAVETTGWDYQRLADAKYVTSRLHFSLRNENLKWSHHKEVASLEPEEQAAWLNRAAVERLSVRALRDAIRGIDKIPPPSLSLSEPRDVPFNHQTRTNIPAHERTAVDEYEQLSDPEDEAQRVWRFDPYYQAAYCKYCYETHSDWEISGGHLEQVWLCERCEHYSADALLDITDLETQSNYAAQDQKHYPLTAANHAISLDPDYDGDEWYTPLEYIEAARRVMGGIDLDPASCEAAQQHVKAARFLTKEDDSLRNDIDWQGRVWINPPYSTPLIRHFVTKLIAQYEAGNVSQAIILTNNSSDTGWFHELLSRYPACFTRGRVQFWRPDSATFGARQGQTLFYLGDNFVTFRDVFSEYGQVVIKA